jgi:NAD(P)-dependent dehydrogenase (short-subunit alcohol dehydrogenase family)
MKLEGKVGVITGGGSGLGREIALEWSKEGAAIVVNSYNAEQNETVVKEIEAAGGKAIAVAGDVRSEDDMAKMAAAAMEAYGRIDFVLAGAGIAAPTADGTVDMSMTMRDLTLAQWSQVIDINLTGVFLTARACIPYMIEGGNGGSIMTITSATVREAARPTPGVYVASKWGVEGFVKRLARELDEFDIRVNVFQPGGMTHTPILGKLYTDGRPDDRHEASVVRPVASYLASEESRLVTGRMLVADQFNRERNIISCACTRCSWRPNPLELEYYPFIAT